MQEIPIQRKFELLRICVHGQALLGRAETRWLSPVNIYISPKIYSGKGLLYIASSNSDIYRLAPAQPRDP